MLRAAPTLLALTALRCAASAPSAPPAGTTSSFDPRLGGLSFMAGSWGSEIEGAWVEETWTAPRAGTMFGVNRAIDGDRTVFFEYLRIEARGEEIVYLASPKGRDPPVSFVLVESPVGRAVFENLEHDFPNRITYWRKGGVLCSQIEGVANGEHPGKTSCWDRLQAPPP